MPAKIEIPNLNNLIERYNAGESILQLAKSASVSRACLTDKFTKNGIKLRSQSESEYLKWDKIRVGGRDAILRQCERAWVARRGQRDTALTKERRAAGKMIAGDRIGQYETEVANLFPNAVQQFSFGIYNIDVALPELRIAIELESCANRRTRRADLLERTEYLVNSGWRILFISWRTYESTIDGVRHNYFDVFDIDIVRQQILAFIKATRTLPSFEGCYRVVQSNGKSMTETGFDFPHLPRI